MVVDIKKLINYLELLQEEETLSRKVREALAKIKESLSSTEGDINVKLDNALQLIEALSANPGLLMHVKTQLWQLTTLLAAANARG